MTEKSNSNCALIQILTAVFRSYWMHSQGSLCWTRAQVRQVPKGRWTVVVTGKEACTYLDYLLQCVRRIRRAPCKSSKEQSHWAALWNFLQLLVGIKMTIQNQAMDWMDSYCLKWWLNSTFSPLRATVTFHDLRRCRKHSILHGFIMRPSSPALTWTTSCRHIAHQHYFMSQGTLKPQSKVFLLGPSPFLLTLKEGLFKNWNCRYVWT